MLATWLFVRMVFLLALITCKMYNKSLPPSVIKQTIPLSHDQLVFVVRPLRQMKNLVQ